MTGVQVVHSFERRDKKSAVNYMQLYYWLCYCCFMSAQAWICPVLDQLLTKQGQLESSPFTWNLRHYELHGKKYPLQIVPFIFLISKYYHRTTDTYLLAWNSSGLSSSDQSSHTRPSCLGLVQSNYEHLEGQRCHLVSGALLFASIFSSIYLEFPLLQLGPLPSHPVQDTSHSMLHAPSQQVVVDSEREDLFRLNKPTSLLMHHKLQSLTWVACSSMTMSFLYRGNQNWTQCFRHCLSRCCAEGNKLSASSAAPVSRAQDVVLKIKQLTENCSYGQLCL